MPVRKDLRLLSTGWQLPDDLKIPCQKEWLEVGTARGETSCTSLPSYVILVHPFLIAVLSSWRSISSGSTCFRQGFPQPSALGLKCGETIIHSITSLWTSPERGGHMAWHAACAMLMWFRLWDVEATERQSNCCVYFLRGSRKSFKAMNDRKTRKIANKPVIQKGSKMRRFRAGLTSHFMGSSNNQKSIAVLRLLYYRGLEQQTTNAWFSWHLKACHSLRIFQSPGLHQ